MLIFEIAGGVVLGLILYHQYKEFRAETESAPYRSPADTPLCAICGHPRAYHNKDDHSGISSCSNCSWYEEHSKEHGWTESKPYSGIEGFMKAGDYSALHYFRQEQKAN